jgi:hypothetical protein
MPEPATLALFALSAVVLAAFAASGSRKSA